MSNVIEADFGKKLEPVQGMPEGSAEKLNQMSVFLHDKEALLKRLTASEKDLFAAMRANADWKDRLERMEEKIRSLHLELLNDIKKHGEAK